MLSLHKMKILGHGELHNENVLAFHIRILVIHKGYRKSRNTLFLCDKLNAQNFLSYMYLLAYTEMMIWYNIEEILIKLGCFLSKLCSIILLINVCMI